MSELSQLEESKFQEFQSLMKLEFDSVVYFLGAKSVDEYTPPNVSYSYDYYEMGLRLWLAFENELYRIICDPEKREPQTWLNELIGGDIRHLATAIILAIRTDLGVSLSIAIPATALLIKRGILAYCEKGTKIQPMGTVKEILEETKTMIEEEIEHDMHSLAQYLRKEQKTKRKAIKSRKPRKKSR